MPIIIAICIAASLNWSVYGRAKVAEAEENLSVESSIIHIATCSVPLATGVSSNIEEIITASQADYVVEEMPMLDPLGRIMPPKPPMPNTAPCPSAASIGDEWYESFPATRGSHLYWLIWAAQVRAKKGLPVDNYKTAFDRAVELWVNEPRRTEEDK